MDDHPPSGSAPVRRARRRVRAGRALAWRLQRTAPQGHDPEKDAAMGRIKAAAIARAPSRRTVRRLLVAWFGGTFLIGYGIGLYSFWHLIP